MEDRYEIRGKIGQGGLGAVYRGYDTRMKREVAIKRITKSAGDPELQEESTRQLMKEAGALASLQHPHIVTIYDVGTDDDGPYVVMELISGKTLEELIEHAPLTWPDFRELAMQTQEALIAAQELDLIHSDIKPSNLMLTWLPSGKFQIKIVDFGLATLTQSQNREELEELEAVFGSIFFMAPEQFERVPLDARSDLYSMGCVYYQALAGSYPFEGTTAAEVMQAHLQHTVKPLQEVRSDIPLWVCDWVMWQINRQPQDRPESARESLSVFLQNDKNPNPTMSLGAQQPANQPKRPRLIIPGSQSVPVEVAQASPSAQTGQLQPSTDPPKIQVRRTQETPVPQETPVEQAAPVVEAQPEEAGLTAAEAADTQQLAKKVTAPQPLKPPEGSKPSVHTSPQEIPPAEPEPQPAVVVKTAVATGPAITRAGTLPGGAPVRKSKTQLSNAAKTTIAAMLGLLTVLLAWYLLDRSGRNRMTQQLNEMLQQAADPAATEVLVNAVKLDQLLRAAVTTGVVEARQTVYQALYLAKSTGDVDVDARIAEFATTREMLPDVREVLIRDVLRRRKNPAVVPTLLAYAGVPNQDPRSAVAALQSIRFMAGDDEFDQLLSILLGTEQLNVRSAAEDTMAQIIRSSSQRQRLANRLIDAYEASTEDLNRHALLRLIGRCSGPKALELVKKALEEPNDRIAAIATLGMWSDDSAFVLLTDFIAASEDIPLRGRAFDSAIRLISVEEIARDEAALQEHWRQLSLLALTTDEQIKVIRGLLSFEDEWVDGLLEKYRESENDRAADLADRGLRALEERRRVRRQEEE